MAQNAQRKAEERQRQYKAEQQRQQQKLQAQIEEDRKRQEEDPREVIITDSIHSRVRSRTLL